MAKNLELRAEVRVPITHRAKVGMTSGWMPCLIQDFSTKGFRLMCDAKVSAGDILELRSELYPERVLECKIEVRHISEDNLGTRIVEVSDTGAKLCKQFIDEHVVLKKFRQ